MNIRSILSIAVVGIATMAPAFGGTILYNNETENTASGGDAIGFGTGLGDTVSDSFTLSAAATINELDLVVWVSSGDPMTQTTWAIGTSLFGSDEASGTSSVTTASVLNPGIFDGTYDIDADTITGLNVSLAAGTYYLTLSNGVSSGFNVYWDNSNGPSSASFVDGSLVDHSYIGSNSESFEIIGNAAPATPEPGTWLMLGSGLLVLGAGMRNRLRA